MIEFKLYMNGHWLLNGPLSSCHFYENQNCNLSGPYTKMNKIFS